MRYLREIRPRLVAVASMTAFGPPKGLPTNGEPDLQHRPRTHCAKFGKAMGLHDFRRAARPSWRRMLRIRVGLIPGACNTPPLMWANSTTIWRDRWKRVAASRRTLKRRAELRRPI